MIHDSVLHLCCPAPRSYCIGLFLAPLVQSFAENHQTYLLFIIGTRMRNAVMSAIYRKCLRLSNASRQAESTGKVRHRAQRTVERSLAYPPTRSPAIRCHGMLVICICQTSLR